MRSYRLVIHVENTDKGQHDLSELFLPVQNAERSSDIVAAIVAKLNAPPSPMQASAASPPATEKK